jgi:two-component system sensor histidine kinase DesK
MSDSATAPAPEPSVGNRALARGITATWWYTVSGVLSFELVLVFMWTLLLVQLNVPAEQIIVVAVGSILWFGSTVLLLLQYRHRDSTVGLMPQWRGTLVPVLVAVAFGAT